MELFVAHRQWASRPEDQRFTSLKEMYQACKAYATGARTKIVEWGHLRTEAHKDEVMISGKAGVPALMGHYAFGQLCGRVGAPASYLRELPATLASQNLNYGLKAKVEELQRDAADASLLFHPANGGGKFIMRSLMTEKYERVWNYEILERLLNWEQRGWKPAVPDFNKMREKDAALYASDHDMFAFLMNDQYIIREPGNPDGLKRGFIVGNCEVGGKPLWIMKFLYRAMCGNHIIWGASEVQEFRFKHVGSVRERFNVYQAQMLKYANESASDEEAKIKQAKKVTIAKTKEDLLDVLFGKRLGVSQKVLEASYDAVLPEQDGDPNTVWGFVQGMTRHSQTIPYTDERTAIDRAAGKVLDFVF